MDGKYLFEVGGKGKGFSQIKDIPESYVVADEIEIFLQYNPPMDVRPALLTYAAL